MNKKNIVDLTWRFHSLIIFSAFQHSRGNVSRTADQKIINGINKICYLTGLNEINLKSIDYSICIESFCYERECKAKDDVVCRMSDEMR